MAFSITLTKLRGEERSDEQGVASEARERERLGYSTSCHFAPVLVPHLRSERSNHPTPLDSSPLVMERLSLEMGSKSSSAGASGGVNLSLNDLESSSAPPPPSLKALFNLLPFFLFFCSISLGFGRGAETSSNSKSCSRDLSLEMPETEVCDERWAKRIAKRDRMKGETRSEATGRN